MKSYVSSFLILLVFQSAASAKELSRAKPVQDAGISRNRYLIGGAVGSTVGFGVGHAIQKRYRQDHAWIFTATEAAAIGYIFMRGLFACDGSMGAQHDDCMHDTERDLRYGFLTYLGFHIWEIVDVWTGVRVAEDSPHLSVGPTLINKNTPGMALALRF